MTSQTRSRICVFIDSNNPTIHNQIIDGSQPNIKLPFPPLVDPSDLVKSRNGKIPTRVPNAFFIYRNVYIETARNDGYFLPMTVISSMASQSWEQESEVVKDEYKRIAREAFDVRNEMLPKANRKRKRQKWNIVSSKEFCKSPVLKTQKPAKEITTSSSKVIQLPSPISSPSHSINSSPVILQTDFTSNETSPVIPSFDQFSMNVNQSPEITETLIEEMIINSVNSIDFNNQLPPSPGSSIISSPKINDYSFSMSSLNSTTETPILTEEELFKLMTTEQHLINYSEFGNFGEFTFSSENLDMSMYSGSYINTTEPSSGLDFDFSHHF